MSESCIWASLTQEVVRRLKRTRLDRPVKEKQEILLTFSQKHSGHTLASSQYIQLHGTVKFLELVRRSALPVSHKKKLVEFSTKGGQIYFFPIFRGWGEVISP